MFTIRTIAVCCGLILTSAGCVQHQWAPGPGATGLPGMVSGQCKLVSIGSPSQPGFVAFSGSPKFVGIATGATMVAGVIGEAVRQQNIYNACMEANGFVALPDKPAS